MKEIVTNLTDKEYKTYKVLFSLGEARVSQIAEKADLERTTVYNFIDNLVDFGLARKRTINGFAYYSPIDNKITKLEIEEEKLIGNFGTIINSRQLKKEILKTLNYKEVDWIVDSASTTELLGNRFFETYIERVKNKKIRVLRSSVSRGKHKYHSQEAILKGGRIVRLGQSTIPYHGSTAIFGKNILMISDSGTAYLIYDPTLSLTYKSLFNGLWKYSKVLGENY